MNTKEKDELFDRKSAQGSVYDKMYFTDDQLKQGAEINQKAAAGEVSWDSAHNWWENTRSGYGYSGGEDGHGYTKIGSKTKETAPSYINQYQGAINQAANALMNRGAFTYDPNTDPMYQQYADSYTRQGKQAMEDTLAQVSARTGGLASSYAGTAAQQTYNGYMSALADKVPELRQLAYQMYMDEGDTMRQNLSMLQGMEQSDYNKYLDALGQWNTNRQFDYNVGQDALAQKNYLAEVAYQKERDKDSDDRYDQEYADEKAMAAAQLLGQTGDYSKYKELLGLSDKDVAALGKWHEEQNAPKVTGGGGDTPAPAEGEIAGLFDSVPDEAITRIQSITNQDELATYLDGLEQSGVISQDTADALYATYLPNNELPDLSKRTWSVVDNGGTNWLWGVDNNAVVQDQYGNSYRLDALVDALVGHGMSSSDAKTYVKNLQKQLGI